MTKKKTATVPERIEAVRDELKSIRHQLSPIGSNPHAELHDVVNTAEKTFTLNDSIPIYLAELRG